jgi:A/G-specific adenine glycosylase
VWLQKRPGTGVWGGLYCVPLYDSRDALDAALPQAARGRASVRSEASFVHALTHKDLHLHPVSAQLEKSCVAAENGAWFGAQEWMRLGLPAPVRRLLMD